MRQQLHLESLDDQMVVILRSKTPTERLAIAHDMWSHARDSILTILRTEHPDWSDEEIEREAARRLSHGAV